MPHNVDAVIADIDDVKDDLRKEFRGSVRGDMRALRTTAAGFIAKDANYTGDLRRSLSVSIRSGGGKIVGEVETDPEIAPYAPFVEFGTGSHDLETTPRAPSQPARPPDEHGAATLDWPFSAPGNVHEDLVDAIIEWVENKPIIPEEAETTRDLGFIIAAQIANEGTYAHPFLQPAWFHHERLIRQNNRGALRRAIT